MLLRLSTLPPQPRKIADRWEPPPSSGFTLLEVLLAVAILGIVLLTVYGTITRVISTKEYAEERAQMATEGREAVLRIADEIEAAMSPSNTDALFQGVSGGDSRALDQVRFVTVRRPPFGMFGGHGGRVAITYSLDAMPEKEGVFLLRRDEVPIQRDQGGGNGGDGGDGGDESTDGEDDIDDEAVAEEPVPGMLEGPQAFSVPVVENVAGLQFRYLDGISGQWLREWDSTAEGDLADRIPLAVDIVLYLYDEQGKIHDYATLVDLPLSPRPTPADGRS